MNFGQITKNLLGFLARFKMFSFFESCLILSFVFQTCEFWDQVESCRVLKNLCLWKDPVPWFLWNYSAQDMRSLKKLRNLTSAKMEKRCWISWKPLPLNLPDFLAGCCRTSWNSALNIIWIYIKNHTLSKECEQCSPISFSHRLQSSICRGFLTKVIFLRKQTMKFLYVKPWNFCFSLSIEIKLHVFAFPLFVSC